MRKFSALLPRELVPCATPFLPPRYLVLVNLSDHFILSVAGIYICTVVSASFYRRMRMFYDTTRDFNRPRAAYTALAPYRCYSIAQIVIDR